ncbi:hypothetical protein JCM3765_000147 [Sporobolomyces pararoseus]
MDDATSQTIEQASMTLEMSIDTPQVSAEPTSIDFSQLKIERIERDPDTLSELGLEDYTREDCDDIELDDAELQKFEGGYVRVAEYGIYGGEDQQYGTITIWYIDKNKLGDDFYWLMDSFHRETEFIASKLFTKKGVFKSKFLVEGTGVWGPEVDVSPLCYLESIKIDKEFRGKGIGTWALEQIWKIHEKLDKTGLEDVKFLITLPAPTPHELTDFKNSHVSDPEEIDRLGQQERDYIVNNRINPFLRRVGFRRIGTTRLFCCARAPDHPSKLILIDQDANEFIPTRPEHFEKEWKAGDAHFRAIVGSTESD